jgi:hypothetical protein
MREESNHALPVQTVAVPTKVNEIAINLAVKVAF